MDDYPGRNNTVSKILFNMDGVVTCESAYWNAAAMTVYEKFYDGDINVKWCEENCDELVSEIFVNDNIILTLKELGVSTNWDLAFVTYLSALICHAEEEYDSEAELFNAVYAYIEDLPEEAPLLYEYIAKEVSELYNFNEEDLQRNGKLWKEMQDMFQHWYLGDEVYEKTYHKKPTGVPGKSGFLKSEEPVVSLDELKELFTNLKNKGYTLGIGTGRNYFEVATPLKNWGIIDFFDDNSFITYDDVIKAEKEMHKKSLLKPHPYMFLKGAYGKNNSDAFVLSKVATDNSNILVVGDAGADIIAAKKANMRFAAVLTGVSGRDIYKYFDRMGADYILDDVTKLAEVL